MSAREDYKLNHADIRAFGRFAHTPSERAGSIAIACRDRQFWLAHGDCPEGAKAALRVLDGSFGIDVLAAAAQCVVNVPRTVAQLRALSNLRRISIQRYPRVHRLP